MKKPIIMLAAIAFVATSLFSGCTSSEKKISKAEQEVQDAKDNLEQQKHDAALENAQDARDWKTYKKETTAQIESNELKIAELKEKLNKSGKLNELVFRERIVALEMQNRELKKRIETYDADKNDWETFKREFSHDMENIGEALQGLTADSEK